MTASSSGVESVHQLLKNIVDDNGESGLGCCGHDPYPQLTGDGLLGVLSSGRFGLHALVQIAVEVFC